MDSCLRHAIALIRIPEVFIVHSLHKPCGTEWHYKPTGC